MGEIFEPLYVGFNLEPHKYLTNLTIACFLYFIALQFKKTPANVISKGRV